MKKIFLALFLVAILSLPAMAATEFVIVSNPAALYTLVSGDESVTSDDFIKLTGVYEFNTIKAALEFANDTKSYINSILGRNLELAEDEDNDRFPDISIKLRATNANSIMGGQITMSDYSVSTLEISPEGDTDTRTLNTPSSATRHFIFDSTATVTLSRLTFEGSNNAGGVEVSSGIVTFDSVNFQNMNISGNGGAVSVSGGSANFLTNTFTNNTAANGGAVAITGGSVNFSDETKFEKNIANSNGGAIFLNASGVRLNLDTITFQENQTQDGFGGAIAVGTAGGSLAVTDSTFSKNVASTSGGAIYVANGSSFTFTGASTQNNFSENEATSGNGGAIYIAGGNSFTFTGDNNFNNNTAGNSGGAVAYDTSASSPIEFDGATFSNNNAINGGAVAILKGSANFSGETTFTQHTNSTNGGAIYAAASGTVNIAEEVTFSDNVAENGSIVYATNGTVNIYTDLVSSRSTGNGGAVYASADVAGNLTVNIYGSITGNTAENGNGGAVYIGSGTVNVENYSGESVIDNNFADCGGAFYLAASNRARLNINGSNLVIFQHNNATTGGGAIYAGRDSRITFSDGTEILFKDNKANNGNGGAIWLGASNQLAYMTGVVTFRDNAAERTDTDDNALGNGGAIYVGGSGTSTVTLTAAHDYTFTNNEAQAYGGAIYTLSSDITFDNFNVSTRNVADIGGGFAGSATGRITLQNSTSVSNQSAPDGGAIYASRVTVNNSKMFSNTATAGDKGSGSGGAIYATNEISISNSDFTDNVSQGTGQNGRSSGGGAIYVVGNMSITDSYFENNTSQSDGAAVFANNDPGSTTTAIIGNSYFNYNRVLGSGNGGAVNLTNNQTTSISSNTFTNNESKRDGGAVYAQGHELNLSSCYFYGNVSDRFGGAVYFAQNSTSATDPVSFNMSTTMFYDNHSFGSGGAAYVVSDRVTIRKCTFYENYLVASSNNDSSGGGLFVNTSANLSSYSDMIENCTFVENYIDGGAADNSGGGALAISSANTATIRSCTFTGNGSDYKGSAIFVHEGTVLLAGTIAVGNTTVGPYDIWVDSTILSGGYNRIGIYGQGGGVTDFSSVTGNTTDRTSYPSRTYMTLRSTYFSDNQMAVNERSDLGSNVPPYIGSDRAPERYRLLTLMLNEDASLPIADRATNAIPYTRRQSFPADDERGVNRRNPNIGIDIGAVFFDGTRPSDSPEENASYSVAYIQISGVPNAIRRVGQTASLIAKIYYTNGRTAYGGTGAGNEPVTWSATPANYLKVNSSTGVITAMRITPQETYVTLKVETNRTDIDGNPASAIARIKIAPALEFGELNNSPESGNSNTVQIIRDLRYEFNEYNMGYGLIDKNVEVVRSYNYIDILETIFGFDDAYAIATTASNYSVENGDNDALTYVINVENVKEGAVSPPMTYLCSFTAEELKSALGSSIISSVARLAAEDETVDAETVKKIFSVLEVNFEGENDFIVPILGPDSSVNIDEAIDKGALEVTTNGQGIDVKLNLMVANVEADGSEELKISESSNENYKGAILISDGLGDDKISGAVVFPQKKITAAQAEELAINQQTGGSNTSTSLRTSDTSESSSGGGTGCNAAGLGLMAMALLILKNKRG